VLLNLDASLPSSTQASWQILAELNLTAESNPEKAVKKWLVDALSPLDLDHSLINRLLLSATEAVAGVIKLDNAARLSHHRLLIMIPSVYEDRGQAWGFFRLAKTGGSIQDPLGRVIEVYLYPEGS
jgi:hypothetical protein